MRTPSTIAALVFLLAGSAGAARAETETTWMKVMIDGRKIGHLVTTRAVEGDRVTTTERTELAIERTGISVPMTTVEQSVETRDGKPLAFSSELSFSGITTVTAGEVLGSEAKVKTTSFGRTDERSVAWPAGAVLAEGARLVEQRHPLVPDTRYEFLVFMPSNLIAVPVKARVVGPEDVTTGLKTEKLFRIDQRMELPGSPIEGKAWVDPDRSLRKSIIPMLGIALEMVACDEACAKAPNQPADLLESTMVSAPRALSREERNGEIETRLVLKRAVETSVPNAAEQRSKAEGKLGWLVNVNPDAVRDRDRPSASDRSASRWLESDHEELAKLARDATSGVSGDFARMMALEKFVRGYITNKSLRVGYASALETVRSKEGDCTEHALLLAALGRAIGIPTRVASGLAYAETFAGRSNVFVPHAWAQAWVGDHWESFDAALPGFDAAHIAFVVNDGDPAGFYSSVNLLGNVEITGIRGAAAN